MTGSNLLHNLSHYSVVLIAQIIEMSQPYEIPDQPLAEHRLVKLLAVSDGLARLDQKIHGHPLLLGLRERLLFEDTCARFWIEGELIHLEELVQLDAGARDRRGDLLLAWGLYYLRQHRATYRDGAQGALLQRIPGSTGTFEPFLAPRRESYTAERMRERQFIPIPRAMPDDPLPDYSIDDAALQAWRRVYREASVLPALLHAAIAWDAWHALAPESSGAWRGAFIGSLVLNARGVLANLLLPLSIGHRIIGWRWDERVSQSQRLDRFLDVLDASVRRATRLLDNMALADAGLRLHLAGRRKNSRLSGAVDLLMNKPVVSIPMLAKHLGMSQQGAVKLLMQLGSRPQLLTRRARYRLWEIPLSA